jgi:peptidoglycan hydrolase CwlO-like protein
MKRSVTLVVLSVGVLLVTANATAAQATNLGGGARPTQEQSLQDLVNEVRQLRAMLQRVNVTVYKTNIVMERLKLQQDLVSRQARELDDVREKLGETRTEIMKLKEVLKSGERSVEVGTGNPDVVTKYKLELDEALQREQRIVMREAQLINELSMARQRLAELNSRLDGLELEIK